MRLTYIIIFFFSLGSILFADNNSLYIKELSVMKRNKPQCDRLGNIYDACQWMLRFTLINSTENSIRSFCSIIKIGNKKYELCSKDNYQIKPKESKVILTNLSELINYANENDKPSVRIISLKGNYIKN